MKDGVQLTANNRTSRYVPCPACGGTDTINVNSLAEIAVDICRECKYQIGFDNPAEYAKKRRLDEFYAGLDKIEKSGISDDIAYSDALCKAVREGLQQIPKQGILSDPRWKPFVQRNAQRVMDGSDPRKRKQEGR